MATEIKNFVGGKVNAEKKDEDEVMIVRVIGKGEILGTIGNDDKSEVIVVQTRMSLEI